MTIVVRCARFLIPSCKHPDPHATVSRDSTFGAPGASIRASIGVCAFAVLIAVVAGCGTTRMSDTLRTATEQLLLSNAIDRAVTRLDLRHLSGKTVYFDDQFLEGVVDRNYLVSSVRQHLLASGAFLKEEREEADYVVEARAGAIGTDRHELLFGVPAVNIPSVPGAPVAVPSSIPEIAFAKKSDQKAVAKIAVFAYNRDTGRPVWQSGIAPTYSSAKDTWLFGAGPFQRGTIHDGTKFAGSDIDGLIVGDEYADAKGRSRVPLAAEMLFPESSAKELAAGSHLDDVERLPSPHGDGTSQGNFQTDTAVRHAMHEEPSSRRREAKPREPATRAGRSSSDGRKEPARRGLLNLPAVRKFFGRRDAAESSSK